MKHAIEGLRRTGKAVPGAQAARVVAQIKGCQLCLAVHNAGALLFHDQTIAKSDCRVQARLQYIQQPVQVAMYVGVLIAGNLQMHPNMLDVVQMISSNALMVQKLNRRHAMLQVRRRKPSKLLHPKNCQAAL